jgi:hypothetical protein
MVPENAVWIILAAIVIIGALAAAILSIWNLTEKANNKLLNKINTQIEESLIRNNAIQEKEFKLLLDVVSMEFLLKLETVKDEIEQLKIEQKEYNNKVNKVTTAQTNALLETFKHDIRNIYFTLRETGRLDDVDKSYVDKIYHHYKELGGNSDIHAKVGELNRIYESQTLEAIEKAKSKA